LRDLESLLASPLAQYLSGGGRNALWLMVGRIPRVAAPRYQELLPPSVVVGPDFRINDPTGDPDNQTTQSETSMAVSGLNIVVGFNDSSVCCVQGSTRFSGYSVSHDGGSTFTDQVVIPAPNGVDLLGDPSVTADAAGNFYFGTLGAKGTLSGIGVAKSTDGGTTFPTIALASVNPTQPIFQDKDYITADTSPTSPFQGNLYVSWGSFNVASSEIDFGRSTDRGQTWSPAIALSGGGIFRSANGAVPAVDASGRVYVAWEDFRLGLPTGDAIFVNRSDDGGVTFNGERKVTDVTPIGNTENCGGQNSKTLNGSIRVTDFPTIAIDKSNGPNDGNVYIAWNDNRNGNPDIFFTRSTDGGMTWSAPMRVNDDATTTDQFMPWMTVDPSGVIFLMWYDRRLDPMNNLMLDVFAAASVDGGLTFSPNVRVTSVSFGVPPLNPNFDPVVAACYMGDYVGATTDATTIYFSWGDNRDIVNGRPDPDVFFRKAQVR